MPRLRLDPFAPNGVSIAPEAPVVRQSTAQQNGYVQRDVTNLIQAGSNVTISGNGTSSSPYVVASSGGGGGGSGSGQTWSVNNVLTPTGSTAAFTTPASFLAGTLKVYLNGLRQIPGASYDYTETTTSSFTFTFTPAASDSIIVDYCTAASVVSSTSNIYGTANYDTTGVYA